MGIQRVVQLALVGIGLALLVLVGTGLALDLRRQGIEDRRAEKEREYEEQLASMREWLDKLEKNVR